MWTDARLETGVPYRATFKLVDIKFTVDLKNSGSPVFRSLESNLISAISSAYQSNSFFLVVLVNGFREGSVVADVTIIFSASQSLPLAELENDVQSDGKLGNYPVELSSIKLAEVSRQSVKDLKKGIIATIAFLTACFFFTIVLIIISLCYPCERDATSEIKMLQVGRMFSDELTSPSYRETKIMHDYYGQMDD